MINKLLYSVLLALVLSSCINEKVDKATITPDISKLEPRQLQSIARDIKIVELNNSSPIGDIIRIKQYKTDIYAFDESSQKILIIDSEEGKIKNILNKRGRSRGEYIEISDFAFNSTNDLLVIFDRVSKSFKFYDKHLNFIREVKVDYYITAMNYSVDDKNLICVREQSGDTPQAVISLNLNNVQTKVLPINISLFGSDAISQTLERVNERLLYCANNYEVNVYDIGLNEVVDTLQTISFGQYSFPQKLFECDDYTDIDLSKYVDARFGTGVMMYIDNERSKSFFYVSAISRISKPRLSFYLDKNGVIYNIDYIAYKDEPIYPLGVYGDGYISILDNKNPNSMNSLLIYNF